MRKAIMLGLALAAGGPGLVSASRGVDASDQTEIDGRENYELRAREELRDLRRQIDELQQRARDGGSRARAKAARQLEHLGARREKTERDLAKLRQTSGQKWQRVRASLDHSLDSLKREYEGLRDDLKDDEGR